jgi:hypothetical protein
MPSREIVRNQGFTVATLCAAIITGSAVAGQRSDGFPPPIDKATRAEIVEWAAENMSERYIEADVGEAMAAYLRSRSAAGAFAELSDSTAFLRTIEQDLLSVSDDKHVALWLERPEDATAEGNDYTPADTNYVAELQRTNYGYKRIEILPGNVGYLRIDEFAHSALGGPTTVAVMNTLANTEALIVDLRWNGGGAGMVPLLCGYFFDEPTHLNDEWVRASDETHQSWTPEYVPGPSLSKVPLYILTSSRTFSAAEDFTYALKHLGRATVVGDRTRGGGHPIEIVRLVRPGLAVAMAVPSSKSINPITGTSWEGVGVTPDIAVLESQALETAYAQALDTLHEQADSEEQSSRLEWARAGMHARFASVVPAREQLEEYPGTYGTRVFVLRDDGVLLYRRDERSSYPMLPLGNELFQLEGYDGYRYQFARDEKGKIDRVISLHADGRRKDHMRNNTGLPH